ncbi:MAG: sulfur reduction protein DsrE [Nitrospirae bacterium]|nr:MAG: sulfur reduction protein DsrE [Nitrospirota bacterium]
MEAQKKLLIIQTSGLRTPERIPAPFFIATTAAAMDMDATMVFTMQGASIVRKGAAHRTRIKEGGASLGSFLEQAIEGGVRLMVCHQALDLVGMEPDDCIDEITEIVGAAAMLDMALEADIVLTF